MFEYAGGTDYALITDRVVMLIDARAGDGFVRGLYRALVAGGGGLDDVLDIIAEAEMRAPVAVIEVRAVETRTLRVAVRGEYAVEFGAGGTMRLGGPHDPDWTTTEAVGVRRFTVRSQADTRTDAPSPRLPLRGGVVRASRIDFDSEPAETVPADRERVEDAATRPIGVVREARPRPADAARPAHVARLVPAHLTGPTHDEAALGDWTLGLPDGAQLPCREPVVFGRRPWHRRARVDEAVHVVVPSPRREISGEQLEVIVGVDGLSALDLGSTNGTLLYSDGKAPVLLCNHSTAALCAGDRLDLGEGFLITVGRARPARARTVGA